MSQSLLETQAQPAEAGMAAVAVSGVRRVLGGRIVLDGLDFRLAPGGRLGIVGRSGAGKSTLLSLIAGLDEPDQGTISVEGATRSDARLSRCVLMPQRDCLLPWRSALDNAALALENAGLPRREARERALPLFVRLGLGGAEQLRPAKLSGGMRQRVAFARTLLADKPVLLLDEPFASLDAITRAELQVWLAAALAGERRTVVLVTHDVEEALFLCDRLVVLAGGRIAASFDVNVRPGTPRHEIVTSAGFLELREQALAAIA